MNFELEENFLAISAFATVVLGLIFAICYSCIQSNYQYRQVEIEAIKAGLVQQPCRYGEVWVKPEDYQPYVIWEKAE